MAKAHVYEMLTLWVGDTQQILKNMVRLRGHVSFTIKHDGDTVSTDHRITIDMKMVFATLLERALKTIVIDIQKPLRAKSAEAAKKWIKEHDPISFENAYPGRRTVVKKDMTTKEMLAALWKEYDGDMDAITEALESQ